MTARSLPTIAVLGLCLTSDPIAANPGPIAQILCAPDAQMRDQLMVQLGTERTWQGLRDPDQIMELWEDRTGDWVLVIAYAGGRRCIVATGTGLGGFSGGFKG